MIRRLVLVVALGLAVAACSSGGDKEATNTSLVGNPTTTVQTIPVAQLQEKASTITDLLVAKKWDDVVATFSPAMAASFTVDGLKLMWGQVEETYGSYIGRGATARTHADDNQYVIFDTPLDFSSKDAKTRISFDANGEVAELRVPPSSTP